MIETLIVPGLNGSPPGHWQHHWARDDAGAELVEQEDWARPVLADWLHALEARIEGSAPGVILVAHSLGCALVAALRGRPAASHVGGALLVAPAELGGLADHHPTVRSFGEGIGGPLPFATILAASRNDPFMRWRDAERHAAAWGSALVDLGAAGHVNIASGFGPWADAPVLADGLRGRPSAPARPRFGGLERRPFPDARSHDVGIGVA